MKAHLTDMLKKTRKFIGTEQKNKAFGEINELISIFPVLKIADFDKPFVLFVDVSAIVGSVLMQRDDENMQ